jgi:hypothetical protein
VDEDDFKQSLRSLSKKIGQMISALAVGEEKFNNRVTKEQLQIEFRKLEKEYDKKLENMRKDLEKADDSTDSEVNTLKIDVAKSAVISAIVTAIIVSVITGLIFHYTGKG